jgi:hypothetical protein
MLKAVVLVCSRLHHGWLAEGFKYIPKIGMVSCWVRTEYAPRLTWMGDQHVLGKVNHWRSIDRRAAVDHSTGEKLKICNYSWPHSRVGHIWRTLRNTVFRTVQSFRRRVAAVSWAEHLIESCVLRW